MFDIVFDCGRECAYALAEVDYALHILAKGLTGHEVAQGSEGVGKGCNAVICVHLDLPTLEVLFDLLKKKLLFFGWWLGSLPATRRQSIAVELNLVKKIPWA